jgi:hypothetical protein
MNIINNNISSTKDGIDINSYISLDFIGSLLTKVKKSKAPGHDRLCYEHLLYGGQIVKELIFKLFSCMLKMSYIPCDMKKGTIITLYKGGKKDKTDPNSYRAITLSSVFIRLYESVLLHKLETDKSLPVNKLQCGFQKQLGCNMTSFALKECIFSCIENKSKVYVCFLDAKQAFDRVWHVGLFKKLYDCNIDPIIYKSFLNMYTGMSSRVKYRGCHSDWFPVLQGTRQGGVSSPKLYLLFIDGLIDELEKSGLGLCIYNTSFASPTVADDMCLVALSKEALDRMLDICFEYSRKWRYSYNASKCAVVVFNEKDGSQKENRSWSIGPDQIPEKDSYTHLGIHLEKTLGSDLILNDSNSKLRSTFFSIIGCGLTDQGINPITILRLYESIVLPRSLFGCELWNDLSKSELSTLETSQHKCIKYMQGISKFTRSDVALSMIGCKSIGSVIEYKKLTFLGQLCRLRVDTLPKIIFNNRLVRYMDTPYRKRGFFPDIYRILCKFNLLHFLNSYIDKGTFPSKFKWKNIIKSALCRNESLERSDRLGAEQVFAPYLMHRVDILTPIPIWYLAKQCPNILRECKKTANLLGRLFSIEFYQVCKFCGCLYTNGGIHAMFDCVVNESARQSLWKCLLKQFGFKIYKTFIELDQCSQIVHLCFGLCLILQDDIERERCLSVCVRAISKMQF